MPVYHGSALKRFLIDRFALGLDVRSILQELESTQKIVVSEAEAEAILAGCEDEIKKREIELREELSSKHFLSAVYEIREELNEVRETAKAKGDLKAYSQLTNSALKGIEILVDIGEKFREKQTTKNITLVQNNFYVFDELAKDGILEIKDRKRLMEIWGVTEPETIPAEVIK